MEIYLMDASDGSNLTRLTYNSFPLSTSIDYGPSWSPDGTQIAFQSYRDGTSENPNIEIYKMDADGSNQTRLTDEPFADAVPAWSPDGTQIAFTTYRIGDSEIYVMDADGSNPTNLTSDLSDDSKAAWSPDGTEIAFSSDRDGDYEIFVMDADGSNPTQITTNGTDDQSPSWSPVPEPSPQLAIATAVMSLLWMRRRRGLAGLGMRRRVY